MLKYLVDSLVNNRRCLLSVAAAAAAATITFICSSIPRRYIVIISILGRNGLLQVLEARQVFLASQVSVSTFLIIPYLPFWNNCKWELYIFSGINKSARGISDYSTDTVGIVIVSQVPMTQVGYLCLCKYRRKKGQNSRSAAADLLG